MKYLPPIREMIIVLAVTLYGLALARMIEVHQRHLSAYLR